MIFDGGADFRQECIRERRNGADALVQYDLFDAMDRKENRIRLNSALLMMSDVIHPVFEGIEVDSPDGNTMRGDIQKPPEEPFSGTVKTDDDDGVQLHQSRHWPELAPGGAVHGLVVDQVDGTRQLSPLPARPHDACGVDGLHPRLQYQRQALPPVARSPDAVLPTAATGLLLS